GLYKKQTNMGPEDGKKILTQVHKKVDQFVRVMKPKSLSFTSIKKSVPDKHAEAKTKAYTHAAIRMAKKYGGHATTDYNEDGNYYTHRVTFKHGPSTKT